MCDFEEILKPLLGMIVYAVFTWLISILTKNYMKFRFFVEGKPLILYENDKLYSKVGNVIESAIKTLNPNITDKELDNKIIDMKKAARE